MCHFFAPVGNRKWCAKTSWTGICTLLWCGTRAGSFMLHSKTDSSRSGKKYAVCSLFWHQHVQSYGLQSFSLPRNLLNYKALPKRGARQTGRTVFQGLVSYPQWWIPIVLQLFAVLWIFPQYLELDQPRYPERMHFFLEYTEWFPRAVIFD